MTQRSYDRENAQVKVDIKRRQAAVVNLQHGGCGCRSGTMEGNKKETKRMSNHGDMGLSLPGKKLYVKLRRGKDLIGSVKTGGVIQEKKNRENIDRKGKTRVKPYY